MQEGSNKFKKSGTSGSYKEITFLSQKILNPCENREDFFSQTHVKHSNKINFKNLFYKPSTLIGWGRLQSGHILQRGGCQSLKTWRVDIIWGWQTEASPSSMERHVVTLPKTRTSIGPLPGLHRAIFSKENRILKSYRNAEKENNMFEFLLCVEQRLWEYILKFSMRVPN